MRKLKNLVGKRFGRLTVISRAGSEFNGSAKWLVRCDCGNESKVVTYSLTGGTTKSCGCLRRERMMSEA